MKPSQIQIPQHPWPPNPPETFDHHVQIHQVGDGVGFAIIQSFQGLQKTARIPEEPGGSHMYSLESVLFAAWSCPTPWPSALSFPKVLSLQTL